MPCTRHRRLPPPRSYLKTVDTLRGRLLVHEWELGLRPIALQRGVSLYEAWVADNNADVSYGTLSQLYEDPTDLTVIGDEQLRKRARSMLKAAEIEAKQAVWTIVTAEAQRLSVQFSEGEFISKVSEARGKEGSVAGGVR